MASLRNKKCWVLGTHGKCIVMGRRMDGTLGEDQWDTPVHMRRRWGLVMYPSLHRHRLETSLHTTKTLEDVGQPFPHHLGPPKLGADNIIKCRRSDAVPRWIHPYGAHAPSPDLLIQSSPRTLRLNFILLLALRMPILSIHNLVDR